MDIPRTVNREIGSCPIIKVLAEEHREFILGNKMITAGQDYFEQIGGNVDIKQAGQGVIDGDKVGGDNIKTEIRGDIGLTGSNQQLATGKNFQQQHISGQEEITDIHELSTKEELTAHYQLLSEKLAVLRKDYIIESDTEAKFKLKKRIEGYEADLKQIEQKLEKLENEKERVKD